MAEGLTRKKRVRGGHRSSAVRTITQIYEAIESTDEVGTIITKLKQSKIALQEKIEIVKRLYDEILGLVDDEEVKNEIEQADTFQDRVQRAIIDSTRALEVREAAQTRITTSTPVVTPSSHSQSCHSNNYRHKYYSYGFI